MKKDIHPEYTETAVTCSCGNRFKVRSTLKEEKFHIEVCDKCHPFYTRQQKIMDTTGRVEKYKQRYEMPRPVQVKTPPAKEAKATTKKVPKKTAIIKSKITPKKKVVAKTAPKTPVKSTKSTPKKPVAKKSRTS